MSERSAIVARLFEEAQNVHVECFPGHEEEIDMSAALSFVLGVPIDEINQVTDDIARIIDHHVEDPANRTEVYHRTLLAAISFGIAAERLNRIEVPSS